MIKCKVVPPLVKNAAARVAMNCIWTADKLQAVGYNLSNQCPKCGKPDSMWHRCWLCEDTDVMVTRPKWASDELINETKNAGPENLLYSRGLITVPQFLLDIMHNPVEAKHTVVRYDGRRMLEPVKKRRFFCN